MTLPGPVLTNAVGAAGVAGGVAGGVVGGVTVGGVVEVNVTTCVQLSLVALLG